MTDCGCSAIDVWSIRGSTAESSGMLKWFTTIAPLIAFFLVLVLLVEPPAIRPIDRIPALRILRGDEVGAWRWPATILGGLLIR